MAARIPDRVARRLLKAGKRPMDGARSAKAASILEMPVQTSGFDALTGHTHALLVTYKRDGGAVPTPVWFAREGDRAAGGTSAAPPSGRLDGRKSPREDL